MSSVRFVGLSIACCVACAARSPGPSLPSVQSPTPAVSREKPNAEATPPTAPLPPVATEPPASASSEAAPVCPTGMVHIQFEHCPKLTRQCLDKEYDKPNHITICQRFAPEKPTCSETRVPVDFCIDEYEYPNELGKKPPVMVNYFEAGAMCAAQHKRLCYEREWVTACEGPDEKPFPYGYVRDNKICNFDNRWVDPHLARVYSKDPEIQRRELARLDRSVPSGKFPGCVSDYGVHDLTGNVDEWATADHERPRERAKFSALKGGAWGHVRNACRPVTTSHAPEFRYYFIGFRCCSDVTGQAVPAAQ